MLVGNTLWKVRKSKQTFIVWSFVYTTCVYTWSSLYENEHDFTTALNIVSSLFIFIRSGIANIYRPANIIGENFNHLIFPKSMSLWEKEIKNFISITKTEF